MNGDVVESYLTQSLNVMLPHAGQVPGQPHREVEHPPVRLGQHGPPVVGLRRRDQRFAALEILNLGPEVLAVGLRSVMAVIDARHHGGDELALSAR